MARSLDRFKELDEMKSKKKKQVQEKSREEGLSDIKDLLEGFEEKDDIGFGASLKGDVKEFQDMTAEEIEDELSQEDKNKDIQSRINELFK